MVSWTNRTGTGWVIDSVQMVPFVSGAVTDINVKDGNGSCQKTEVWAERAHTLCGESALTTRTSPIETVATNFVTAWMPLVSSRDISDDDVIIFFSFSAPHITWRHRRNVCPPGSNQIHALSLFYGSRDARWIISKEPIITGIVDDIKIQFTEIDGHLKQLGSNQVRSIVYL